MHFFNKRALPFIEMCTRNSGLRHPVPVGDAPALVFDIDDCLYRSEALLFDYCDPIRRKFMELANSTLEEWEQAQSRYPLHRELFYRHFGIHPSVFCAEFDVSRIDQFIDGPDHELKRLLEQVPHRKFCFTNGCVERARKILGHLQLDHVFEAVICADVQGLEFISKPQPEAFEFLDRYAGISDPRNVFFFDDSHRNVAGAERHGWNVIHVTSDIKGLIRETLERLGHGSQEAASAHLPVENRIKNKL